MAQIEKIEAAIRTKCSPSPMYGFFKSNMSKLVDIVPQQFQSAELIEGEEGCTGSVKLYKYNLGGPKTVKVKLEAVDDVQRSITYEVLEGDVMELYKTLKAKVSVLDGSVKWCFEFEKVNDACPKPDIYIGLATQVTNVLDAYFVTQGILKT